MPKSKTTSHNQPWQTGDYAEQQQMDIAIPYQLLLLCKLCRITPKQLLIDFMDNLAHATWKRNGRNEMKMLLVEYFIMHGYGNSTYSEEEIRMLFTELDAVGMLFPSDAKPKMLSLHCKWRSQYHDYWYRKWRRAVRRVPSANK